MNAEMERISWKKTFFLMVKPDGVQRALIGDIVARFEKEGVSAYRREAYANF
ncbi:hypothetical protein GCM10020331_067750 [Ectobacillus funiculus]